MLVVFNNLTIDGFLNQYFAKVLILFIVKAVCVKFVSLSWVQLSSELKDLELLN